MVGTKKIATEEDIEKETINYALSAGRVMASPLEGEEIVISGISGSFPKSNNIHEYRDNLFNKVNMVLPNKRWDFKHPEVPLCSGTIPVIDKYDAGFFGNHGRQSESMDPMNRICMEKTIEAIFDAGLHPSDLENTRTGVFIGACFSETSKTSIFESLIPQNYALTGCERSMLAHRLSYILKLKGPSYVTDTACSSSLYAFEHAFRSLRLGEIDNAIVGGANLCLHPFVSLQFARLGVLSRDGTCKAFDAQGNGYARSEAIGIVILQKQKNARRIYANVLYAKTNCDGYKEQGITFPSRPAQKALLDDFYDECDVDRSSLSFLEAHGTGTLVGDPQECSAIDEVFTKNRTTPLLIGSVKSNIGHSEPSSGICAIIKCIIGMETGFIPPNIHYSSPRGEIKGLVEGRMKVVTDKIPFEDNRGLVGINSFGFGGGNCHILLRKNTKEKVNKGLPNDNLPRLVCVSGRTEEAITSLLDEVRTNQLDTEFVKLLHDSFRKKVENHLYRGYIIISKSGEITRSLKFVQSQTKTLYIAFGEINNWGDVGNELMSFPVFAKSMQRTQQYLLSKGVDILELLRHDSSNTNVLSVVGNIVVQIGIMEILKLMEIKPKGSYGNLFSNLLSAYFDGILPLTEILDCALIINGCLIEVNELRKSNNYNRGKNVNSKNISNGHKLTTASILKQFKDIFSTNNLTGIKEKLVPKLLNVLQKNNSWSSKTMLKKYKSPDLFINSLVNTNLQDVEYVEHNLLLFELGESEICKNFEDASVITFTNSGQKNCVVNLLNSIGSLYEYGFEPQISNIYPSVQYPVSRGTPMISPSILWKHDKEWFVVQYNLDQIKHGQYGCRKVQIQLTDHQWSFISGHVVDGRNLFPATGYLYLVWETFSLMNGIAIGVMEVVLEDCRFLRATAVPKKGFTVLIISIQRGTGTFEVADNNDSVLVTGRIALCKGSQMLDIPSDPPTIMSNSNDIPLTSKDIYKELRLRGYNYKGGFRSIINCDSTASNGYIKWLDNWIMFMDNMLQMKILQTDTRLLYVPTYISKLAISAQIHLKFVNDKMKGTEEYPTLPVFCDPETGELRCGGISIKGLIASSISRKKITSCPVIESFMFVPNFTELDIESSIRVNMQIILENALLYKVKVVEVIDEFTNEGTTPLAPVVHEALGDQPLIQPFIKILSKTALDVCVEVEDIKLQSEADCLLVILSNISKRPEILHEAQASLKKEGYIMSRESLDCNTLPPYNCMFPHTTVITVHKTATETLFLLRMEPKDKQHTFIKISSAENFEWVPTVQEAMRQNTKNEIVLYAENEPTSGILGLVNCLRREPDGRNIKCVFVMDTKEEANFDMKCYGDQLKRNIAINVYKNGQWGTYRHLLLNTSNVVEREHCYVNVTVRGDLSSLRWIEGPLHHNMVMPPELELIYMYYGTLNFRDIMTATGKINVDAAVRDRIGQECVQGFEYSGRDKKGNRVMGMISHGALSTLILADPCFSFDVPDTWSLEEAATVPVIYGTVLYALIIRGQMKKGQSILIHCGAGGVGQAAIRVALHYGCKVYTTVGTQEKRDFIKKIFPQIKDCQIGNSRDESFEQMIYEATQGNGVDLLLNSLAEDKLLASVRCLAKAGKFFEIGKFDLANNNHLNILLLQKEASFHGIMLDQLFSETPFNKMEIKKIILEGLQNGAIQPLCCTVFKYTEIEHAFRLMAAGKHMGKVIVQIRKPEKEIIALPDVQKFTGITKYSCKPNQTYVIVGGLGGFGLELADWLVLRGAKKLVLTSRKGITTGYQNLRIRLWRSYGVTVNISTAPITTEAGCKQLIEECQNLGSIDAIFNLAVVLADSLFENQSPDTFKISFGPKACATQHLDELSREMCQDLSDFVVFSSVSCGRGNQGQTNYGMANSVMERICEKRKQDGYPALAIEWGAIGDVGLVAEMQEEHTQMEISGTLQQQISSCLKVLDNILRQKDATIVSSMVVAEKLGAHTVDNVVDAVINILGLNDVKCVSLHSTLAELGMDSMTAVEIKQTLERDFEVFLSAKDIRTLTLARLKEIQQEKCALGETNKEGGLELNNILAEIGDEQESLLPYIRLPSKIGKNTTAPKVLFFPGIEGFSKVFEGLVARLECDPICLQLIYISTEEEIIHMVETLMPIIEEHVTKSEPFFIVGYSYGCLVALEVIHILESQGHSGTLVCIDGAPLLMKTLLDGWHTGSDPLFQTGILCHLLSFYITQDVISSHKENIFKCDSWEDRLNYTAELAKQHPIKEINYLGRIANGIYKKLIALKDYSPSYNKLKSTIKLYKPKVATVQGIAKDYDLSRHFENIIEIQEYDGNHITILDNILVADSLNACLHKKS